MFIKSWGPMSWYSGIKMSPVSCRAGETARGGLKVRKLWFTYPLGLLGAALNKGHQCLQSPVGGIDSAAVSVTIPAPLQGLKCPGAPFHCQFCPPFPWNASLVENIFLHGSASPSTSISPPGHHKVPYGML